MEARKNQNHRKQNEKISVPVTFESAKKSIIVGYSVYQISVWK